jgi:alginate O-acetyltransferase complex protein AlgI
MLVMLLGGLWHGAAWKFLVWGGLHGGLLALERYIGKRSGMHRWPPLVRMALTYVFVLFTWVFFRAADLASAVTCCKSLLGFGTPDAGALLLRGVVFKPYYLATFALCAAVVWAAPQTWDWSRRITWPKIAAAMLLLTVSIILLSMQSYNPFIYFIF